MAEKRIKPGPLASQVAQSVRQVREQKRLRYTEIADRIAEIGRPIPELGLSRVEKGERRVDLDDLVALARALGVPPVWLIFPVGSTEFVELLPGKLVPVDDALSWFIGEGPLPEADESGWEADAAPMLLRQRHRQVIERYASAERVAKRIASDQATYDSMTFKIRAAAVEELRSLREEMRRHGLALPPVPVALDDAAEPVQRDPFVSRAPQPGADRGPED